MPAKPSDSHLSITTNSIILVSDIQLASTCHVLDVCEGNSLWYCTEGAASRDRIASQLLWYDLGLPSDNLHERVWYVVDSISDRGHCCSLKGTPEHTCSDVRCFSHAYRYPRGTKVTN